MSEDPRVERARNVSIESVITRRGIKLKRSGAERIGPCPRCGGTDRFSINTRKGVFNCRGCGRGGDVIELVEFLDGCDFPKAVETLTGEARPRSPNGGGGPIPGGGKDDQLGPIVATFDYNEEDGSLRYQVTKHEPKTFRQRRPDGNGGWVNNVRGIAMLPYRLPELLEAIAHEHPIVVVEGETDADTLTKLGVVATCNTGGAGKWGKCNIDSYFAGANVVIIGDVDPQAKNTKTGELRFHEDGRPVLPGQDHAADVARHLSGIAKSVRMLDLSKHWPNIPPKSDISDWLALGHSREDLDALIAKAEDYARRAGDDAALFDPWERYIVPEFPLHVLPETVQRYVTSQSVVIGCDPAALAMSALTAISGALDHRFAVKMMRNGNWWEHPRLWTLLVGDPSRKKTPIINDVTRPLERHQNDLRRDYEARLRDYERDNSVGKPDPPVRYVVSDTTYEKLGEILSRSEHGLLVKRDEFSGWIGGMEKYSSSRGAGADRGFWLKAFDGGPYTVDRVGRGEIYVGNLSVSLLGGIQPAKLAELHGLTSDGLLQRFIPVMMRASTLAQDCDSGDDQENYQQLVYKLIAAKHQRLFLSDHALWMMSNLRKRLHELEQAAAGLADGLQAFIGKLAGLAGRLAVVLHMAEYLAAHMNEKSGSAPREIEAMTVAHVQTLILDFILPHAVEFYRSSEELTDGERLRKIASWILTSQQKVVTSRDLIRNIGSLRGVSVLDLQTLVSPLVAAGWLEPAASGPLNREWTVSPKVAAQFERQRKIEEERKTLAAKLMGSPRKPAGG